MFGLKTMHLRMYGCTYMMKSIHQSRQISRLNLQGARQNVKTCLQSEQVISKYCGLRAMTLHRNICTDRNFVCNNHRIKIMHKTCSLCNENQKCIANPTDKVFICRTFMSCSVFSQKDSDKDLIDKFRNDPDVKAWSRQISDDFDQEIKTESKEDSSSSSSSDSDIDSSSDSDSSSSDDEMEKSVSSESKDASSLKDVEEFDDFFGTEDKMEGPDVHETIVEESPLPITLKRKSQYIYKRVVVFAWWYGVWRGW